MRGKRGAFGFRRPGNWAISDVESRKTGLTEVGGYVLGQRPDSMTAAGERGELIRGLLDEDSFGCGGDALADVSSRISTTMKI